MNHTEKTVPVWKKYSLNVSEGRLQVKMRERISFWK